MAQTSSRSRIFSRTNSSTNSNTNSSTFFKQFVPAYRFTRIEETVFYKNHFFHAELNSTSIKVLNWNIAKNNHASEWSAEFSAILEEYDPDLVVLQEVRLTEDAKLVGGLAEMSWSYAPNFVDAFVDWENRC